MKKTLISSALAASILAASGSAFATETTLGVSYGSVAIGDSGLYEEVNADHAVVLELKHEMTDTFFVEGRYTDAEIEIAADTESEVTTAAETVDLEQISVGAGINIDAGLTVISNARVGGGYFKDTYSYESYDQEADGFYLKGGLDVETGVTGLTLSGDYTYYVGELDETELDYEYGVFTAKAEYEVTSSLVLTGAVDFADSESAYRVGGTYNF